MSPRKSLIELEAGATSQSEAIPILELQLFVDMLTKRKGVSCIPGAVTSSWGLH